MNTVHILNRVFTRNTLRSFIEGKQADAYVSVVEQYIDNPKQKYNQELICDLYKKLKREYRNEYFYKNSIFNKLLLGVHSINTTTALTEVAISKSKADFVLINGKAVAYEIKTELDNLERLESQIEDYYKAFDHVAVVTYKNNIQLVERVLTDLDKPVGIYILSNNGNMSLIKKPEKYTDGLDKDVIFKLLRKNEYESIIKRYYGWLPQVTQFRYYSECKDLFRKIPIDMSYKLVLTELKGRMQPNSTEFDRIPYEIKFLAYFMELKSEEYKKLNAFLKSLYGGE